MLKMYNFDYLLARSVYDFDIPVSAKTIYFSLSFYVLETDRSKEKSLFHQGENEKSSSGKVTRKVTSEEKSAYRNSFILLHPLHAHSS